MLFRSKVWPSRPTGFALPEIGYVLAGRFVKSAFEACAKVSKSDFTPDGSVEPLRVFYRFICFLLDDILD